MTNQKIKDIAKILGSQGGKAKAKKYGKKHYKSIGKLGAEKRWGKKK